MPVTLHRLLLRRYARGLMVRVAQRAALIGLALLAVTGVGVGVVEIVFDALEATAAGWTAAAVAAVVLSLWWLLPLGLRHRAGADRLAP